jgi:hypothetical protein
MPAATFPSNSPMGTVKSAITLTGADGRKKKEHMVAILFRKEVGVRDDDMKSGDTKM